MKFLKQLKRQLINPKEFFSNAKTENWKSAFIFFLWITLIISIATPIVNFLGIESIDLSSSYQAQIIAYNLAKNNLFLTFGLIAYVLEAILIFVFAISFLLFLTAFLHLIYRLHLERLEGCMLRCRSMLTWRFSTLHITLCGILFFCNAILHRFKRTI